jgi:hypothetical protein
MPQRAVIDEYEAVVPVTGKVSVIWIHIIKKKGIVMN